MGMLDLSLASSSLEAADSSWVSWRIQWLVSQLHGAGLEWWAAIASVTLLTRTLTAPLYFQSIVTGARLAENQSQLQRFYARMLAARDAGDTAAAQSAALERVTFVRANKLQVSARTRRQRALSALDLQPVQPTAGQLHH